MKNPADPALHADHDSSLPRPSFWRKLGGGSLSISLIVHGLLLAIGVVWVFKILPEKKEEKEPIFSTGGKQGGSSGKQSAAKMTARTPSMQRIAVTGQSSIVLPEFDANSSMTSISIGGGVNSLGPGIGRGPGNGDGDGDGVTGRFKGAGLPMTGDPNFGFKEANANSLVGTFFDTKQDSKRKPTEMTPAKLTDVIKDFTTRGWNERMLDSKYFQAPQKLYQTKVYIPVMSADRAPKAFNCEKEVQPKSWMVIYRGSVTPPKSGKYRFVGAGDDVLVVRFNNQNVFDHGFTQGTTGLYVSGKTDILSGKTEDKDLVKSLRGGAMKLPITFYQYDTTQNWNKAIGGLAVGPEFEANAGTSYPIEILISEIPGGLFGAALLIQETGVNYPKASTGAPILPLFRLDDTVPAKTSSDNAPPYDTQAPPWKLTGTRAKLGI